MRTVAIIQARLGSTRLPWKALLDIVGQTMLARTVIRTRGARTLNAVAVATTTCPEDVRIIDEAGSLSVPCFRGSEDDVLDRYVQAARQLRADVVVRVTSDCPLVDPEIIDLVISAFSAAHPAVDYASNTLQRTYPRGLDVEVFTRAALEYAGKFATEQPEREHVTLHLYRHPDKFRLLPIAGEHDYSHYRWTVDTLEDLEFVREVYRRLAGANDFSWRDVLALIEREPALAEINRHVVQKKV
jgi:spore coat polysaccharide biosynthesis protein SpsF